MRLALAILAATLIGSCAAASATFLPPWQPDSGTHRTAPARRRPWAATTDSGGALASASAPGEECPPRPRPRRRLGLLTFDLDDTLFPIGPVVKDANVAMVDAMVRLGYRGAGEDGVVSATKRIRRELSALDETVTYTDLRMRAVRHEMERILSEDLALLPGCDVVHKSVAQRVFDAWLDERQRSAERRLFPGALEALESIRSEHDGVVIGAVTNGRGDPLDIPALQPYFDFCVSGEDEGVFPARKPHRGIYDATLARYEEVRSAGVLGDDVLQVGSDDAVWVHVGDDLANDVGASAACGARAVWVDMNNDVGEVSLSSMTEKEKPVWSTATPEEIEKRKRLGDLARASVSARVTALAQLPSVIATILES